MSLIDPEKLFNSGLSLSIRKQPGFDHNLMIPVEHDRRARHMPDCIDRNFRQRFDTAQMTELDGIKVRRTGAGALADHFSDPAVQGDSEILLADRDPEFGQNPVVGLAGRGFVVLNRIPRVAIWPVQPESNQPNSNNPNQFCMTDIRKGGSMAPDDEISSTYLPFRPGSQSTPRISR